MRHSPLSQTRIPGASAGSAAASPVAGRHCCPSPGTARASQCWDTPGNPARRSEGCCRARRAGRSGAGRGEISRMCSSNPSNLTSPTSPGRLQPEQDVAPRQRCSPRCPGRNMPPPGSCRPAAQAAGCDAPHGRGGTAPGVPLCQLQCFEHRHPWQRHLEAESCHPSRQLPASALPSAPNPARQVSAAFTE